MLPLGQVVDNFSVGSVVDAWVDTRQLSDFLSYASETLHRFYNNLGMYPYMWNQFSQQLFDNMFQTYDCSKVFAENSQGDAIDVRCQFDLVRSTPANLIISSYFIPSMIEGITLMLDSSPQWCLSFNVFHSIPTMKFEENYVEVIVDKSLVFILEFEEAVISTSSIFRAYERSALPYHYCNSLKFYPETSYGA
ncbi:hypothetical protein FXO38_05486 [Capsicum annuum]|nr:hypothetical protein FXO38_05486 [Capsicum annuum]